MKISQEIILLYKKLETIYKGREKVSKEEDKIEVEEIASHFASLYEKLRNSIDFKEVHLLRRFSIERNLKRRFIMEMLKPNIAQGLIEEMIRARYLPNNTIPETKVKEIEGIIAKYNQLYLLMNDLYHGDEINEYFDWLIGVEACEIDMALTPEDVEDALIEAMYQVTKSRVKLKGDGMGIQEKNVQLYISIHKSLVKSDDTIISYHLLNLFFDQWAYADDKLIKLFATKLPSIYKTIQAHITHPYQRKILQSIKEPVVTFQILHGLILDKGRGIKELLIDPTELESEAKILINQKYKIIRTRIRKASVRAIIYIFITKALMAIVLEFPYEMYVIKEINYINLGINVVFPPLLMFLVTMTVRPPSKKNTEKILQNISNLVYNHPEKSILCKLKTKYRKNTGFQIFYYFMYTILYVVVFGAFVYLLRRLDFNPFSGAIFLFFLTAVSFFAIRIRNTAKEFLVLQQREGLISFLINFFSLPIVAVGRWMSTKFKKINVFAFVMDFIIEAPFKLFVSAFEDWLGFMKEKKDEVYHDNK
jgi:hypothetical protein